MPEYTQNLTTLRRPGRGSGGLRPPDPLPGLCPLGDSRPPDPLPRRPNVRHKSPPVRGKNGYMIVIKLSEQSRHTGGGSEISLCHSPGGGAV